MPSSVALDRRLSPFSAALFGLSYICPTVVLSTYGVLAQNSGGAPSSAYAIATAAMLLTSISYGRMAARFPQAGSAYTYVSHTANPAAGFIAGWVLILDYFFVPMVICLFTAKAIEAALPAYSYRIWVLLIAVATTVINILGIQIADRVNLTIMAAQLAVIAGLIILCGLYLHTAGAAAGPWSVAPFVNAHTTFATAMSGAAIAAYSFLGFDAVTTLSEETHNPTRSIPRATVFAVAASGTIYVTTSYLFSLVHPSLEFRDVDNAGYQILAHVSGPGFSAMFAAVLVAFVASVMCAQAGSSRLLYAMGRDRVLPGWFAYVHPRLRTPVFNIALTGAVMLIGLGFDVETAASCVNFGAFSAFMAVNLCVVIDHLSGRRALPGGAGKVALALAGAVAAFALLISLHSMALTIGFAWLAIGLSYRFIGRRLRPLLQRG